MADEFKRPCKKCPQIMTQNLERRIKTVKSQIEQTTQSCVTPYVSLGFVPTTCIY